MVLLGAIAKASGFIPLEKVQQLVTDTLGKKYPKALEGNLKGIQEGFNSVEVSAFEQTENIHILSLRKIKENVVMKML